MVGDQGRSGLGFDSPLFTPDPHPGSLVSLPVKLNVSLATRNASPWRAVPHATARYSSSAGVFVGERDRCGQSSRS